MHTLIGNGRTRRPYPGIRQRQDALVGARHSQRPEDTKEREHEHDARGREHSNDERRDRGDEEEGQGGQRHDSWQKNDRKENESLEGNAYTTKKRMALRDGAKYYARERVPIFLINQVTKEPCSNASSCSLCHPHRSSVSKFLT